MNTQASRIAWMYSHISVQTPCIPTARIPRLHLPCPGSRCSDWHSPAGKTPHSATAPQPRTTWHSAARRGTARHGMAQRGTARHSTAQHGAVWHSAAQHGAARRLLCTEIRSAAHAAQPTQRSQPCTETRGTAHAARPTRHSQPCTGSLNYPEGLQDEVATHFRGPGMKLRALKTAC